MKDHRFGKIWADALTQADRDAWISDWALSSIWGDDPEAEVPAERVAELGRIWDAAHMSTRDLVAASGMTQAAFADRFLIAKRTVESWCGGKRQPPEHVRFLLALALDLI